MDNIWLEVSAADTKKLFLCCSRVWKRFQVIVQQVNHSIMSLDNVATQLRIFTKDVTNTLSGMMTEATSDVVVILSSLVRTCFQVEAARADLDSSSKLRFCQMRSEF